MERARAAVNAAELIIAVFDTSRAPDDSDREIISLTKGSNAARLVLFNKSDLPVSEEWQTERENIAKCENIALTVSAKCDKETTLAEITRAVERLFTDEKIKVGESPIIFTARAHAKAARALELIESAYLSLLDGHSQDTVSSDVERALAALTDSDAREVSEDVVSDIFSKFCVGK